MKTVTIHDAKTNLSKYIAAAKKGEKIYIGSFGKPEVMLNLVTKPKASASKKRDFSKLQANIWAAPDAFSEATDKEIAELLTKDDLNY
ncbi:MAG: type II toxin-antitoxin system Phd/YefM family antitoxin [Candidatus Saccharimonadales bacterium]